MKERGVVIVETSRRVPVSFTPHVETLKRAIDHFLVSNTHLKQKGRCLPIHTNGREPPWCYPRINAQLWQSLFISRLLSFSAAFSPFVCSRQFTPLYWRRSCINFCKLSSLLLLGTLSTNALFIVGMSDLIVRFNVGGRSYAIMKTTFPPDSVFYKVIVDIFFKETPQFQYFVSRSKEIPFVLDKDGAYFVDRDPDS